MSLSFLCSSTQTVVEKLEYEGVWGGRPQPLLYFFTEGPNNTEGSKLVVYGVFC